MPVGFMRRMVGAWRLKRFNPRGYHGKVFETSSGSRYWIDGKGRIHGHPSIEDASVAHVVGLSDNIRHDMIVVPEGGGYLPDHVRDVVVPHILREGMRPKKDRKLLVVLRPDEAGKAPERTVFLSSALAANPKRAPKTGA